MRMKLLQRVERLEAKATREGIPKPMSLIELLNLTDADRELLSCGSIANMPRLNETVELLSKLTELVCESKEVRS